PPGPHPWTYFSEESDMKELDSPEENLESTKAPTQLSRADLDGVHKTASDLIEQLAGVPDGDIVGEMVANSLKLLRDQTNRGDLKMLNKSLKELRYAIKVFAPYRDVRKVSIFGSARTPEDHPDYLAAAKFGKAMVAAGWMVITGAGGGGHGCRARRRRGGAVVRSGDPLAFRAADQCVHRERSEADQLQVFLHPQVDVRSIQSCHRPVPRRVRHDG